MWQKKMWQKIIEKLTSGRFILTLIAGMVFAYCAVRGIITSDKTYDIISIIVVAYFMRSQNGTTPKP